MVVMMFRMRGWFVALALLTVVTLGLLAAPAAALRPRPGPCPCEDGWHSLDLDDPCGCLGVPYNCYEICVYP